MSISAAGGINNWCYFAEFEALKRNTQASRGGLILVTDESSACIEEGTFLYCDKKPITPLFSYYLLF